MSRILAIIFLIVIIIFSPLENNFKIAAAQAKTPKNITKLKDFADQVEANIRDAYYMARPGAKLDGVVSIDGYDAYMLTSNEGYYGLMNQMKNSTSDEIPENFKDLPNYDVKTIRSLLNMVTPKAVGGEGQEWIKVKTIDNGYNTSTKNISKENQPSEEGEGPISAHSHGQAVDVSEKDFLKCTQVYIDENETPKVNREKSKAVKPIPINFHYQSMESVNGIDNTNGSGGSNNAFDNVFKNILDSITNGSFNFHGAIGQLGQSMINQFIGQIANDKLGTDINLNGTTDFHSGLPYTASQIFSSAIISEAQLPQTSQFGFDFKNTIENFGASAAAGIFNNNLGNNALKGDNLSQWQNNIGREEIAKKMLLPEGSIIGENSDQIIENIGKAKIGAALGVDSRLVGKNINDNGEFRKSVGQALIEKYLNLPTDSISTDNWDETMGKAGLENFNARFVAEQIPISATILGVDSTELANKINNRDIAGLKLLVGSKSVDDNFGFYNDYTTTAQDGTQIKINSRDEAFDLVDYGKPYFAPAGQRPDWIEDWIGQNNYDYKLDKAHIITVKYDGANINYAIYEIDPNDTTNTYEKLLMQAQQDPQQGSITQQIVNGNINAGLFQRIGRDTVAKGLSSTYQERQYLRYWLESHNLPTDSNGRYEIDTLAVGSSIGLKDRYDLARLFVENRVNEVSQRIGRVTLENSISDSAGQYLTDNYLEGDPGNSQSQSFIESKMDQLEKVIGQNAKINIIKAVANKNLSEDQQKVSILVRRNQQSEISKNLFEIGKSIIDSNSSQEVKNNAQRIINETIEGRNFVRLKDIPQNTKSNLNLGITQQDIKKLLANENNVNINQFIEKVGVNAVSSLIGSSEIEDPNVKNALQYALQYGPNAAKYPQDYIGGIVSRLDNKTLNKAANIYGFALGLKNTFTGDSFAKMTAGNQMEVIKNTVNFVSNIFEMDPIKIKGLFGGDGSIANEIPFGKFLDGISGLMTSADQLKNIFSSSVSGNFADRMMQGINMLPTILGYFQNFSGEENDPNNQEFNKIIGLANKYWRDGQQAMGVINDFKNIFGANGFNVADAITYLGSLPNTLRENSILQTFNGIKLDFGLDDLQMGEKLPDWMRNARWANFLSAPNNKTVGDWVNTVNSTFNIQQYLTNQEQKDLYNFGTQILTQGANQQTIYPIMDYYLRKDNKDIPLGFTQSMLSGDYKSMMGNAGKYMQNWANDPKNNVSPEIASAISPVMNAISSNNWDGLTDVAKQYGRDWLSKPGNWSKFFGDVPEYLKNPILDGLTTGDFNSFINSAGNNWGQIAKGVFGKGMDDFFGQMGATAELNNQFWQNPFKSIMGENPFGINPQSGDISKFFGNAAEGAFNSAFAAVTTMLMSSLDPAFAGLEESLGLPSGTISGLIGTILPALFLPHYNIAMAVLSYLMPTIFGKLGLGSFGKIFGSGGASKPKAEVWCAMDYYPVLEVGKDQEAPKYDIAYGSNPPAVPYLESQITINNEMFNNEKANIGDGSGGPWKVYDNGKEQVGEFKIDNDNKKNTNSKVLLEKLPKAAVFKIKQLIGELIRIDNDVNKTGREDLIPRQIKTYKENQYSTHYLYRLNILYGVFSENKVGEKTIQMTMKENMDDFGTRRGIFAEKYHIDNVHWGY